MEDFLIREVTDPELDIVYDWMRKQFDPGEIKPLWSIRRMLAEHRYSVYGMWRGEDLYAYALLAHVPGTPIRLLDYFAVLPDRQDKGIGSRFLSALRDKLTGLTVLLESEDADTAPDERERNHRERRLRFYRGAGCTDTGTRMTVFGFDYAIWRLCGDSAIDTAKAMEMLYRCMLPEEMYEKNIHFRPEKELQDA